jgi:hypothetical protein
MTEPLDADPVIAIALPNSAWNAIVQCLAQHPYREVAGYLAQIHMQSVAAFELIAKAAANASPTTVPTADEPAQAASGEAEPIAIKEALH